MRRIHHDVKDLTGHFPAGYPVTESAFAPLGLVVD